MLFTLWLQVHTYKLARTISLHHLVLRFLSIAFWAFDNINYAWVENKTNQLLLRVKVIANIQKIESFNCIVVISYQHLGWKEILLHSGMRTDIGVFMNKQYDQVMCTHSLYSALVRSCLKYFIQLWDLLHRKAMDLLQQFQRRAAEMITGLEHLVVLGLFGLKMRNLVEDLTVLPVPKGAAKRAG